MPTQIGRIETYQNLLVAMADYLNRSDLTNVIPLFVQFCEADLNRKLRSHDMVKKAESTGTGGDKRISLPTGWKKSHNLEINGMQYTYQSGDVLDMMREQSDLGYYQGGCHFTYVDSCIEIWPVPDADYDIYLEYTRGVTPVKEEADGKNWLLTDNPDAYLYGSLVHAAPYLRDDARIALWSKLRDEALSLLNDQSEDAMHSGSRLSRKAQGFG